MNKSKFLFLILLVANFVISPIAHAHPGRTDTQGCHTCYTNCTEKWGLEYNEYHCHEQKAKIKTEARKEARKEARNTSK